MNDRKRDPVNPGGFLKDYPALRAALVTLVVVVAVGAFAWGIRTGIERSREAVRPIPPGPLTGQATNAPGTPAKEKSTVPGAQPAAGSSVQPTPAKAAQPGPAAGAAKKQPAPPQAPKQPASMAWPYQGGILKPFGWAYSPTMEDWRFHQGIDIAGNDGDEVVAAMGGRVELVEESAVYGKRIVLLHPADIRTIYSGLKDVLVKTGETVQASQPLASMGKGPFECAEPDHLHFEVITGKGNVDPAQFLR